IFLGVIFLGPIFYRLGRRRVGGIKGRWRQIGFVLLPILGLLALLVVIFPYLGPDLATLVFSPLLLGGVMHWIAGPYWCFGVGMWLIWRLWPWRELSAGEGWWSGGIAAVLGVGYLIALQQAWYKMLEIYARLPVEPPADCYVVTAAAEGHGMVVRREARWTVAGKRFWVTAQLQQIKGLELLWRLVSPRTHGWLRWVYDGVGPRVAGVMRGRPWLAAGVYVSLMPVGWVARLVLGGLGLDWRGVYGGRSI
ncbi:MAG TPA: hypothetical protein VLL52_23065, partial [Anaerolineae bacterium]|nr:hypothetical protein [Anaerolineae bacterium]